MIETIFISAYVIGVISIVFVGVLNHNKHKNSQNIMRDKDDED